MGPAFPFSAERNRKRKKETETVSVPEVVREYQRNNTEYSVVDQAF